jgi:hypothetical protein
LSADRVRSLHRDERKQIDRNARLTELDDGHQPSKTAPDDDDSADIPGLG